MSKPIERRCYTVEDLEIREGAVDSESPTIQGYAAVFDEETIIGGGWGYREVVKPGAFKKTLSDGADVRALWNHDTNFVLGRTKSNTLEVSEDNKGLRVKINPPDTQWANDLQESIKRGDVSQMSFGFRIVQDKWTEEEGKDGKLPLRELQEVELFDVSPVTFPAYEGTEVALRARLEKMGIDPSILDKREQEPPGAEEKANEAETEEAEKKASNIDLLKKRLDLKARE